MSIFISISLRPRALLRNGQNSSATINTKNQNNDQLHFPSLPGRCITVDRHLPSLACLVANDTTDNSTANGSGCAAAGQYSTTDRTGASADSGVLPLRHAGTSPQTEQHGCGNDNECGFMDSFHGITSFSNILLLARHNWPGPISYLPNWAFA
jgi:hypothetical protein